MLYFKVERDKKLCQTRKVTMQYTSYLLFSIIGIASGCDVGWFDAGGDNCYLVSRESKTFAEAQEVYIGMNKINKERIQNLIS